jgi:fructose-specific phosphotransferase system component IIB
MPAVITVTVEITNKDFALSSSANVQVADALHHAAEIVNQWHANEQTFYTQKIHIDGVEIGYVSIDDSPLTEDNNDT